MTKDFYSAVRDRRSFYAIGKTSPVPDARIREVVEHALTHAPAAFGAQSARAILLFGENHDRLWRIVMEALRKAVPADKFAPTEAKVNSFAAGHGSVLYFEDQAEVEALQGKFPLYADNFVKWSQQAGGIAQYIVWTSLECEGLGASLQHYNPLIDDEVKKAWDVPDSWRLVAQMPFGAPAAQPGAKELRPVGELLRVAG
ncbi:MAG: nitroreductase family protein [Acidobacteriota bacterium]|jgi:predicted oxidoreductase (fatty acid repression mutant protein)|nr:nitroreductase family protein [Acidobacteriota bacterium]